CARGMNTVMMDAW
nr:immunoglobulin heavy chain junction region [Macaca mulatta]